MEIEDKNAIVDLNDSSLELGFIKKDIIKRNENNEKQNYILVFDLGGGIYDLSLIELMELLLKLLLQLEIKNLGMGTLIIN